MQRILETMEKYYIPTASHVARKKSLLTAMEFIRKSWDSVEANKIENCWKKAGLIECRGAASEFEDEQETVVTFRWPYDTETVQKWIEMDS